MKKLTIMVSIYQSGDWIENRLNNLMQSTLIDDMEIWCVNADSPDERDHTIPQKFKVKYVRLPNRINVYAAWNYILKNSDSQYVTNANTDDIVAPNCYEKLINVLESNKEIGLAYPSWYCTARANQQWGALSGADPNGRPGHYNGDIDRGGVGHFPLWRRTLHTKLGLFDDSFKALGDAEWWARCWFVAKTRFQWVDELLAVYLWRNGQNLWHREVTKGEWLRYHKKVSEYKRGVETR